MIDKSWSNYQKVVIKEKIIHQSTVENRTERRSAMKWRNDKKQFHLNKNQAVEAIYARTAIHK